VRSTLFPTSAPPLPADLAERLLAEEPERAAHGVAQVVFGPTLRARLARFTHMLFPQRQYMASKYRVPAGSPRLWLFYLWRPMDLAWRFRYELWAMLRRDTETRTALRREAWLERWLNTEEGG